MNDLIKQFPDATKKDRKHQVPYNDAPDSYSFWKTFGRDLAVLMLLVIATLTAFLMLAMGQGNAD
jgi:hypothetical protein